MTPLEIAISQLGKSEEPRGSNWGSSVQKYLKSIGINFPASWCMAFVYWCFEEYELLTGHENHLIKTGGVLHQWNQIGAKYKIPIDVMLDPARKMVPLPGDIFIMDYGKGRGHTGIVESYVPGNNEIVTIEGNTNDEGDREGYEVARRQRPMAKIKGFIRIPIE